MTRQRSKRVVLVKGQEAYGCMKGVFVFWCAKKENSNRESNVLIIKKYHLYIMQQKIRLQKENKLGEMERPL